MPQGSRQLKEEKLTLVAGIDPRPLSACARGQIRVQNQAPRRLWQPLRLARDGPQLHQKQRRGLPPSAMVCPKFCLAPLGLLAPQSGAHTIAPHRDTNPIQSNPPIAVEQENPEKTHDVIYF